MPAYSFEALDAQGALRRGVLEADTARAARGQLRAQTLVPLRVEPVAAGTDPAAEAQPARTAWQRRVFNGTALALWTRQLAGLVASGLPLERALTALTDEAETEAQRNLCASLRAEVNAGSSFARALSRHPREFADIYVAVVAAGEQGGRLDAVLLRLADDLEEQQALRSRLPSPGCPCPIVVSGNSFKNRELTCSRIHPSLKPRSGQHISRQLTCRARCRWVVSFH